MRTNLTESPADHIVLVGTGAAAMAALWRLRAAGASIRWYPDSADVGAEAVLAHALGGGRIELSLDDPLKASLDGAAAVVIAGEHGRHARFAERARASGVPVRFVGAAEQSDLLLADLVRTLPTGATAATA